MEEIQSGRKRVTLAWELLTMPWMSTILGFTRRCVTSVPRAHTRTAKIALVFECHGKFAPFLSSTTRLPILLYRTPHKCVYVTRSTEIRVYCGISIPKRRSNYIRNRKKLASYFSNLSFISSVYFTTTRSSRYALNGLENRKRKDNKIFGVDTFIAYVV